MDVTFCFVFGAVSFIFGYFFPEAVGTYKMASCEVSRVSMCFKGGRDNKTLLSLTVFEGISKNHKTT